jgi:processive 1,2-diacylglycerol beta-glucosyltransferase
MKRILIFHISQFGGHSKAAQNVKEAFSYKNCNIDVVTLNGLGYFYPRGEKIIDLIYLATIKYAPRLWGKVYDRQRIVRVLSPYRRLIHQISFRKLDKLIEDYKPDCFIATQAFPCGLIADFKEKTSLKTPLVGIVTDYYPHRFWIHPLVDRYIVACQEAKEVLINEGVNGQKIKIQGIPISVKFLATYPKDQISQEFGFRNDSDTVLIMGGGLGIGPIKLIAKELDALDDKFQIIVVCGKNKKLYRNLTKNKNFFRKPIFIFGYIDYIHKLMDFSDIIITKGGGITISEALAKSLCIVVTKPIPGQERRNVDYLLKKGAIVEADTVSEIKTVVGRLLRDKKKMYYLKEAAKESSFIDSSLRIIDLVSEIIN